MKQQGFTFTEMLLVLTVLMVLIGIGVPTYRVMEVKQEERRFFEMLLHDVYAAQSESYATSSSVGIVFRGQYQSYDIVRNFYRDSETRKIPASVVLLRTSNITSIYYSSAGDIMSSGTLRFSTSEGERRLVVHLGKGRVVLSE